MFLTVIVGATTAAHSDAKGWQTRESCAIPVLLGDLTVRVGHGEC